MVKLVKGGWVRWFDIVWIAVWAIVLVVLGAMATGLYSENLINTGNIITEIFAAVLVIPPVVRVVPPLLLRRQHRMPAAAAQGQKVGGN